MAELGMADFWQMRQEGTPLMVLPAIYTQFTMEGYHTHMRGGRLLTMIRHEDRGEAVKITWAGINWSPIHDFCGGCFITSFNLHTTCIEPRWAGANTLRHAMAIPTPTDMFGENAAAMMEALYVQTQAVAAERRVHHSRSFPTNKYGALVTSSLYANLFARMAESGRDECTLWDTKRGVTRQVTELAHGLFADTELCFSRHMFEWDTQKEPSKEAFILSTDFYGGGRSSGPGPAIPSTFVYLKWPKPRFSRAVVNRNSGCLAGSGSFRTSDQRSRPTTGRLLLSIGNPLEIPAVRAMCQAGRDIGFLSAISVPDSLFHQW